MCYVLLWNVIGLTKNVSKIKIKSLESVDRFKNGGITTNVLIENKLL